MQSLVVRTAVVDVALVVDFQGFDQERQGTGLRLVHIALLQLIADFQQLQRNGVFAHQKASQMVAHAADKMLGFKAFADDVVQ